MKEGIKAILTAEVSEEVAESLYYQIEALLLGEGTSAIIDKDTDASAAQRKDFNYNNIRLILQSRLLNRQVEAIEDTYSLDIYKDIL